MRRRLTPVAVLCALLVIFGQPAAADTPQQQLERAQDRLDDLAGSLEIQIEECNLRREQVKAAKRALQNNRAEYDDTQAALATVDNQRGAVVAQMYMRQTSGQEIDTLTASVASLSDYAERLAFLDLTRNARTTAFERYAATQAELAASGDLLEQVTHQAQIANAEAQRTCEKTRQQVEAQEERIGELAAEVERLERQRAARDSASEPGAADSAPVSAPNVSGSAGEAVAFGLAQVGKPYGWGGSGPGSYDCSGLTMASWAAAGVSLPHNSGMQYSSTSRVSRGALQPGDLLFFGSPIHHVGMYVGNGKMVESPHSGLSVRVVSIDRSDYVGAGRP